MHLYMHTVSGKSALMHNKNCLYSELQNLYTLKTPYLINTTLWGRHKKKKIVIRIRAGILFRQHKNWTSAPLTEIKERSKILLQKQNINFTFVGLLSLFLQIRYEVLLLCIRVEAAPVRSLREVMMMAQSTTNAVLRPKWVQITGSCRYLMAAFDTAVHNSQAATLTQQYYASDK